MKRILLFALALCLASVAVAQMEYPLASTDDISLSSGDVRCGKFMILTPYTSSGPSILFRYVSKGQETLKVVPQSAATMSTDNGKTPSVNLVLNGNEVSSARFLLTEKEAKKARGCLSTSP